MQQTMLSWIESYHSGQLAALGGALMLAAAGRLRTKPSWQMSVVLGVGVVILANNRPFEGLVLCVGIGLLLLRRPILRVAPAGLVVVAAGLDRRPDQQHVNVARERVGQPVELNDYLLDHARHARDGNGGWVR